MKSKINVKIFITLLITIAVILMSFLANAANEKQHDMLKRKLYPNRGQYKAEPVKKKGFKENFNLSLELDLLSQYVSHARVNSLGPVMQPSITFELYDVGFSAWGNFVINDEPNQGQFNEIDLTLFYNLKIKNFTFHPHLLICFYPNDNPASLNYSTETDIMPNIDMVYTIWHIDLISQLRIYARHPKGGIIWQMGPGFHHRFNKNLAIETAALVALANSPYNNRIVPNGGTNFNYVRFDIGLAITPIKGFTFKPNFHYSTFFREKIRNALERPTAIWGGVNASYSF